MLDLSIVVPVYNEEENLRELFREITTALSDQPYTYEVVFVDDGSSDHSFKIIESLHEEDERVVGIKFRRNHAKQPALPQALPMPVATTS